MNDPVLDNIDAATTEVETQLLSEFNRARTLDSGAGYCDLDKGISNALTEVVAQLWYQLGNSGDIHNLTLRTDRHESLEYRLMTIKKLIDAKVSIDLLHDLHQEVIRTRRALNIQTDTAQRQLALLATCFKTSGDVRKVMQSAVTGKASFESKELSSVLPQATRPTPTPGSGRSVFEARDLSTSAPAPRPHKSEAGPIARSPEEIRKKLEQANRRSTGASRFEARDLGGAPPSDPAQRKTPDKPAIAQTPEEIRRKLMSRQGSPTGRAAFTSRDIEPASPPVAPVRKPVTDDKNKTNQDRQTGKPRHGRAVFEARDVSNPPPDKKS